MKASRNQSLELTVPRLSWRILPDAIVLILQYSEVIAKASKSNLAADLASFPLGYAGIEDLKDLAADHGKACIVK